MKKYSHFRTTEKVLTDYILSFPEPAHMKEAQTKKYICSNQRFLKIFDFDNQESIVGLTLFDLERLMKPSWKPGFVENIADLDQQVVENKCVVTVNQQIFLDKEGLIHIQNMTKFPLLRAGNEVSAIMTTCFDVTKNENKVFLFKKYFEFYKKSRPACSYFMKYLGIDRFFAETLTKKEIICLLAMTENKSHKYLSRKLELSVKTIETHVNHIISKLKNRKLSDILLFLHTVI